jgi:putative membrane protein
MTALHLSAQTDSFWLSWSLDPIAIVLVPLAALLYAHGLRTLGPSPRFHDSWRPWAFYSGLALVLVALISPLDHLSDELFIAHMAQHILLMLVAAPLVLLGAPMIPILRGVPRSIRRKVVIPIAQSLPVRMFLRLLTAPLVAWPLYVGVFVGWHIPGLYVAALEDPWVHTLEHAMFAAAAYLFWWNVIDPLPLKPNLSYLLRVPYVFVMVVPTFILGAFITFTKEPWYAPYALTTEKYALSHLEDQQLGGAAMWIAGSFIMGAAMLLNLLYVVRTEQAKQDAEEQD